jgi:adenylate cyclase
MTHSIIGAAAWHTHPLGMERRLAAILSADVQGYSQLMHEDETATIRTLTTYRGLMGSLIQQYRGRVVDDPGDNLLAEFPSVVEAVQCAVTIQRTLAARNAVLPSHRQMVFRMGLHLGDIVVEQERIYGAAVNLAARLERVAEGGGLCISGTVYDHVVAKLPLDSIRDVPIKVYVFTSCHRYIVASEQGIWKKVVEKIWRKIRPSASRVTLSQPCRGYLQR